MIPTRANPLRPWVRAVAKGWSFVEYDAHHARWCILLACGVDIPANVAAFQPPHLLTALSERDPRGRPTQIGEGAANVYLLRPADRGSLCFGIALANRDSGKSLLPGTVRLCLRR